MLKKNPLSLILGAYLQQERHRHGINSTKMSDLLDIGNSIYRMVEAGSANLNISRSWLLAKSLPETKIMLEPLALYLTAVNVLELEKEKRKSSSYSNLEDFIVELDEKLEYFIKRTSIIFTHKYGTDIFKRALAEIGVEEIKRFLGNKNYLPSSSKDFEKTAIGKFSDVPSINMISIMTFIESQAGHVPLHVGPVASEWEEKELGFIHLKGFYKKKDIIISDENLNHFLYPYLSYQTFDRLEMIFITDTNPSELKKEFVHKLNIGRKRKNKDVLKTGEIAKITFKAIKENNKDLIEDIDRLVKGRNDIFSELNAYWNFTLRNGVETGFVGGAQGAENYAINLSYGESLERVKLFNDMWDKI